MPRLAQSPAQSPPLDPRVRELHVSRRARERYGLEASLFATVGSRILANFDAARKLASRMAAEGGTARELVTPGAIHALGLIDELLHGVFRRYRETVGEDLLGTLLDRLATTLGEPALEQLFAAFVDEFPPHAVWAGESSSAGYVTATTGGEPHREQLLEELVVLWLANQNPAFAPYRELFDDRALAASAPAYAQALAVLAAALDEVKLEPAAPSLLAALRQPIVVAPLSLEQQLAVLLDPGFAPLTTTPTVSTEKAPPPPAPWTPTPAEAARVLRALDLFAEERPRAEPGDGPQTIELPREVSGVPGGEDTSAAQAAANEPQAFTPDQGWMPRLVLLAKNTLVWLAQLSRRHGREITRLDQIPDSELDEIVRQGFTGLWLIGLWQRSNASRTIKRLCGNPEAESSAYAITDYQIASELGGEVALVELQARAAARGLRLASDMVPNHTAIDGRWVLEHPERFVQVAAPPFPVYTFEGPDLSPDPQVGIYLEDHYYRRSDAAVVFKRLDRQTGQASYLYHGNDGTHLPWNDTAQLDVLQANVRAALIDEILRVSRRFPIVRFDAAMTLAKRHHHRLWYPAPGSGGDIPSRAEHGISVEELDLAMPAELWREVVDRVAVEAPDTLLLAEAFWLMETYFVRTLGLHRVYNSAFMHTVRGEDNTKLRELVTRIQRFDREVLRRFVNFLSNPDEEPAAVRFGDGGKFWAASTLLATMPGLPMFGHGQVEGLHEKYGMEFARPRRDEDPDPQLLARHRRELAPLLAQRQLFAGAADLLLFDFAPLDGAASDDALIFANRHLETRTLVLVHHRQAATRGWITTAPDPRAPHEPVGKDPLPRVDLASALGLDRLTPGGVAVLTDPLARQSFLVPVGQLARQGLYVELGPYERRVFLGSWQLAEAPESPLLALAAELRGQGLGDLWPRLATASDRGWVEELLRVLGSREVAELVRPEYRGADVEPAASGSALLRAENELRRRAGFAAVGQPVAVNEPPPATDEQRTPTATDLFDDGVGEFLPRARAVAKPASPRAVEQAWATSAADPGTRLGVLSAALLNGQLASTEQVSSAAVDRPDWLFAGCMEHTGCLLWLDVPQRRRALALARAATELHQASCLASGKSRQRVADVVAHLIAESSTRSALGVNHWRAEDWLHRDELAATLIAILADQVLVGDRRELRRVLVAVRQIYLAAERANWSLRSWTAEVTAICERRLAPSAKWPTQAVGDHTD